MNSNPNKNECAVVLLPVNMRVLTKCGLCSRVDICKYCDRDTGERFCIECLPHAVAGDTWARMIPGTIPPTK